MADKSELIIYYENYSPVGDVLVISICLVFVVLMCVAYNVKTRNYRIFQCMIASLVLACISDLVFHIMLNSLDTVPHYLIYIFRFFYHFGLFVNLFLYVVYVMEPLQLDLKIKKGYKILSLLILVAMAIHEILGVVFRFGLYIDENKHIREGINIFPLGYAILVAVIIFLLLSYRGRMVRPILYGIIGTFMVSFLNMLIQGSHGQMSFTTACFLFPLVPLLYLIHSNPYNIEIGAVNVNAFEDMISYINRRGEERVLMSLYLNEFEGTGKKYPKEIHDTIRKFTRDYFRGAVLFQLSNGRMVLTANPKKNPNYRESGQRMLDQFYKEYPRFRLDFKIAFLKTYPDVNANHDYLRLFRFIEKRMNINSVCIVGEKEIEAFRNSNYVLAQLEDICKKNNLNDERVEVYCQPVLNILTGKYDTAEALMRLRLPETGIVFPDVFIPIAEEQGYIHTLSLIILHKTCMRIKKMLNSGYNVQRISVNFSVSEFHNESFASDVSQVISQTGIPMEKIAIEITESQNEAEFQSVKEIINELRGDGIKFYLDDFGTGYSNFERIMELPFDIIKFDRSLVIACASDEKSEKMVTHMAQMFSAMDYSVLYEGVETDQDEEKCIRMSAKYLQGYKYSKPIPIEQLTEWFEQTA